MTDMPERIWATLFDTELDGGTFCDVSLRKKAPNKDADHFTRTDIADAQTAAAVAAALEGAANICECVTQDGIGDILREREEAIRALITPTGRTALDAMLDAKKTHADDMKAKLAMALDALHKVEDTGYVRAVGIARAALTKIGGA